MTTDEEWEYAIRGDVPGDSDPWITAVHVDTRQEGEHLVSEWHEEMPDLLWTLVKRHKINSWEPA